ncbi:hypothetical protein KEM48_007675 [Puccinia striiformis f. sp. tritici PST-130]|nr:hypothetical protein KEM48_007675 [Puccinia striiformis f. sp. tritici PST-130]
MGNLRALLDTPGLPASIQPHISQLKSLFEPIPFKPEIDTRNHPEYLDSHIFNELIEKLNDQFSLPGKEWVSSTEFCQKDLEDRLIFSPTSSQVILLKNHPILDVNYSTHIVNKNNSVVALKPGLKAAYGQIESIFKHSRDTEEPCILFHENEILCHCAWIKYNPGELSTEINFETLALVPHLELQNLPPRKMWKKKAASMCGGSDRFSNVSTRRFGRLARIVKDLRVRLDRSEAGNRQECFKRFQQTVDTSYLQGAIEMHSFQQRFGTLNESEQAWLLQRKAEMQKHMKRLAIDIIVDFTEDAALDLNKLVNEGIAIEIVEGHRFKKIAGDDKMKLAMAEMRDWMIRIGYIMALYGMGTQ